MNFERLSKILSGPIMISDPVKINISKIKEHMQHGDKIEKTGDIYRLYFGEKHVKISQDDAFDIIKECSMFNKDINIYIKE